MAVPAGIACKNGPNGVWACRRDRPAKQVSTHPPRHASLTHLQSVVCTESYRVRQQKIASQEATVVEELSVGRSVAGDGILYQIISCLADCHRGRGGCTPDVRSVRAESLG